MNSAARTLHGFTSHPTPPARDATLTARRPDHRESGMALASDGDFLTLEEAAVAAGVSVRTLARYRKAGSLAVIKVGRRVLCSLDAVREAMVQKGSQSLGRDLLGPSAESMPLSDWWTLAVRLAEEAPAFDDPNRLQKVAEAVCDRSGAETLAGHLRVGELRRVLVGLNRPGIDVWSFVLVHPDDTPVISALRSLRDRFRW